MNSFFWKIVFSHLLATIVRRICCKSKSCQTYEFVANTYVLSFMWSASEWICFPKINRDLKRHHSEWACFIPNKFKIRRGQRPEKIEKYKNYFWIMPVCCVRDVPIHLLLAFFLTSNCNTFTSFWNQCGENVSDKKRSKKFLPQLQKVTNWVNKN